jgi:hypothetical protein
MTVQENYAGNTQKSNEIMRMNLYAAYDKEEPENRNIKDLKFAAVKLNTTQGTEL